MSDPDVPAISGMKTGQAGTEKSKLKGVSRKAAKDAKKIFNFWL